MSTDRYGVQMMYLGGHTVLAAGGTDLQNSEFANVDMYFTWNKSWALTGPMLTPRIIIRMVVLLAPA